MFQSLIEETKNNMNKEPIVKGTVIQNFYDGANIFITGGTGECTSRGCVINQRDELHEKKFRFSRFHGESSDR